MQHNGKIRDKFKVVNQIYDDKNFAKDVIKIYPKTCNDKFFIQQKSLDTQPGFTCSKLTIETLEQGTASNKSINENSINNNYHNILSNKSTNEHINSDDPSNTASDNEITIISIEHHLPDRITSVGNLNVKRWNCITRLESLKDEFNLKAFDIKRNLVLRIETLKDQATTSI